ncbi:MAG TPA: D-glycero-beta-D-manno-heptose 1-phosphate adenylyltransferase [Acidobacteria bacterium]|nr:D-glycero-beta-D-manno-heptose 1-phosphate adenylyltransferase [Acidobacteriota bacterium]
MSSSIRTATWCEPRVCLRCWEARSSPSRSSRRPGWARKSSSSSVGVQGGGASSLEELEQWRDDLRRRGLRLCLTNGCFDLLHAGHVQLLADARAMADALVVALNTDASVRRLKGPSRPLVPEAERAELLAALESVDRVVLFDEPTPLEVIVALRPDVLAKGADWAADQIVGAEQVRGWGGRVERLPLVEGLSTSAIIERVRRRFG